MTILEVGDVLQGLATTGGVPIGGAADVWLRSIGAAHIDKGARWLCTDPTWFRNIANARDRLDLIRRTAICDPLYRFHIDAMLSEILELVARGTRWHKTEELLFGPLLSFAPRFVQLLELASEGRPVPSASVDWAKFRGIEGAHSVVFEQWDRELWGDAPGGPAALFPLLRDLYIPLRDNAVTTHSVLHEVSQSATALLAAAIECARRGESFYADPKFQEELAGLQKLGLPVRRWMPEDSSPDRRMKVGLVAPVRLLCELQTSIAVEGSTTVPMNKLAIRDSSAESVQTAAGKARRSGLWEHQSSQIESLAFAGLDLGGGWPAETFAAPEGVQVPPSSSLRGLALSRKRSPNVDAALETLADHLVFGLVLQFLLLEALDRELGQDAITLSLCRSEESGRPLTNIRVFYQPVQHGDAQAEGRVAPTYELGDFDKVLDRLTQTLRIRGAGLSSSVSSSSFWRTALLMLEQVGIVSRDTANTRFFLSVEALDRLHGGELMARVIRNGHPIREALRTALIDMWKCIDETSAGQVMANVN